jgi:DNA-binding CsgD family transcriptional regulator/PAS domain-containing protein
MSVEGRTSLQIAEKVVAERLEGEMRAVSVDKRDSVIESLYSAAGGLRAWDDALAQLSDYCGAKASYINVLSKPKSTICLVGAHGHTQALIKRYQSYGHMIDPTNAQILANFGQPIHFNNLLQQELGGKAFHREFIASRDTDHLLAIGLESEVGTMLVKLSRDSKGQPFTNAAAARLEGIAHHLRQAVVIDRNFGQHRHTNSFATSIVNRLRAGVISLDGGMNVRFANQAAERMANDGDPILLRNGQLSFVQREVNAAFLEFTRRAAASEGDWSATFPLSSSDKPKRGRVWAWSKRPLTQEFALMILQDEIDENALKAMLNDNYDLSPSEVRTVIGVLTQNGLAAVAKHSGVSVETVRFHMKRIFAKTGTCRQSELVRVIVNDLSCVDWGIRLGRHDTHDA